MTKFYLSARRNVIFRAAECTESGSFDGPFGNPSRIGAWVAGDSSTARNTDRFVARTSSHNPHIQAKPPAHLEYARTRGLRIATAGRRALSHQCLRPNGTETRPLRSRRRGGRART